METAPSLLGFLQSHFFLFTENCSFVFISCIISVERPPHMSSVFHKVPGITFSHSKAVVFLYRI